MENMVLPAKFFGTDESGKAKACRQLAIEADALATAASNPETRADYLELKRQWNTIADELERDMSWGQRVTRRNRRGR